MSSSANGQIADLTDSSADSSASEPPQTGPSADVEPAEAVAISDQAKDAVAEQSEVAGSLVETLDTFAITVADTTISLWDVILVVLVIGGIFTFAWLTNRYAHKLLNRISGLDQAQKSLFDKIISLTVWTVAILVGFDFLGIDLTALAFFSGAFGLAIGFGLQKTFGNLVAGIILLMDRSIKPGDVISVADSSGVSTFGQIRRIGIRAVSVTTRDQREYLIPNENLMVNQVENWSYSSKNVRMRIPVGIAYSSDIEMAEQLMLQAANATPRVLKNPPPSCWLAGFGDSSVDFIIHCWINDPESGEGNVRSQVLKKLWHLFKEHNVEIPFPQRDLNLRSNEDFQQLIAALEQRGGGQSAGGQRGGGHSAREQREKGPAKAGQGKARQEKVRKGKAAPKKTNQPATTTKAKAKAAPKKASKAAPKKASKAAPKKAATTAKKTPKSAVKPAKKAAPKPSKKKK